MAEPSPGARAHRQPLVVVDDAAVYPDIVRELAGAGWTLVPPRRPVGAGQCVEWIVSGGDDAAGAVLAAASGDPVVARVMVPPVHDTSSSWVRLVEDLVDDLGSIGPVLRPDRRSAIGLDQVAWQVAHDLGRGLTLDAAAARAHISVRTANRRLLDARAAFGSASRAQLLRALRGVERVPPALIPR